MSPSPQSPLLVFFYSYISLASSPLEMCASFSFSLFQETFSKNFYFFGYLFSLIDCVSSDSNSLINDVETLNVLLLSLAACFKKNQFMNIVGCQIVRSINIAKLIGILNSVYVSVKKGYQQYVLCIHTYSNVLVREDVYHIPLLK